MTHPLLGIAIGDALGMPFETAAPDDPRLLAWDGKTFEASPYHKLSPGQWTDDTQMSLCLAQSLIAKRHYDVDDAAARYLAWYQSGKARGTGGATRQAMEALARGAAPCDSGVADAMGAGSAMRAIPLGVYFRTPPRFLDGPGTPQDPRAPGGGLPRINLRVLAARDAGITHASREAREASFVVAHLADVFSALALDLPYPQAWIDGRVTSLVAMLLEEGGKMQATLIEAFHAKTTEEIAALGAGGACFEVVPTALACFLSTTTYEDAVVKAIRLGGDTDTRAAIVGGWAGLYRPIPPAWVEQVEESAMLQEVDRQLIGGPRGMDRPS